MKTIGILGGMGPMATLDLSMKIVTNTKAHSDREHIHMIIDSDCSIPDRTAYILGRGENPTESMIEAGRRLQSIGAEMILIPCNTAHYFYKEVAGELRVPVVNMIEETASILKGEHRVGLMATEGTYRGKVYEDVFARCGIDLVIPTEEMRHKINEVIYDYKGGKVITGERIEKIEGYFLDRGVKRVILGCTELPLVFKGRGEGIEYIDPTDILSRAAIKYAGKETIN